MLLGNFGVITADLVPPEWLGCSGTELASGLLSYGAGSSRRREKD